jgi:hypothetical protein
MLVALGPLMQVEGSNATALLLHYTATIAVGTTEIGGQDYGEKILMLQRPAPWTRTQHMPSAWLYPSTTVILSLIPDLMGTCTAGHLYRNTEREWRGIIYSTSSTMCSRHTPGHVARMKPVPLDSTMSRMTDSSSSSHALVAN